MAISLSYTTPQIEVPLRGHLTEQHLTEHLLTAPFFRSMLLLGGHGRTNNMGVDGTRNDIFEYTFRNERWLPVLVDDAALPRPDARFGHAGDLPNLHAPAYI